MIITIVIVFTNRSCTQYKQYGLFRESVNFLAQSE